MKGKFILIFKTDDNMKWSRIIFCLRTLVRLSFKLNGFRKNFGYHEFHIDPKEIILVIYTTQNF